MPVNGTFIDSRAAGEYPVAVGIEADGLVFTGPNMEPQVWRSGELSVTGPCRPGKPFRLTHIRYPGCQLALNDEVLVAALLHKVPRLRGSFITRRSRAPFQWFAGGFAAISLAVYIVLQLAPQPLAFVIPGSWRDRIGARVEASLAGGAKLCAAADARSALSAMVARIAEGNPPLQPAQINVYDMALTNAWAMPGGRIVITRSLIAKADAPEEVAGVLAHELGHTFFRHSEAQIIRATGLQLLASLINAGNGDTMSSLASVTAILKYSREAEAEADAFALRALENSAIDPVSLKRFFERMLREEGAGSKGTAGKIEEIFSTHPGMEERINSIRPLPTDIAARPVLSAAQWQALKNICK